MNHTARAFPESEDTCLPLEDRSVLVQRIAALERSNAELRQFATVAAHDLNEPIRTMSGFLRLLRRRYRGRLDERGDEFIGLALDGATRLQDMISSLLSYSRADAPGPPPAPVDCNLAVGEALSRLGRSLRASRAEIEVEALPVVAGDARQVEQLFQNLIHNAVRFAHPDRRPGVRISAEAVPSGHRLSIVDNGIGVDPASAARLFRPFERLQSRQEVPGNGLGLAICRRIVERHGGRIWLEPRAPHGTAVRFTLPAFSEGGS